MPESGANRAYLSLGSNINPEQNLPAAVRALAEFGRIEGLSRVWESAPFGTRPEALSGEPRSEMPQSNGPQNFLNAAVLLATDRSAAVLCIEIVPQIEGRLGRVRDPLDKNAPRTIDIDLSLFNRDVLVVGHRHIPDPDILKRAFVAVPLAEIDPDYVHPVVGRKLVEIATELAAKQALRLRTDVELR